MTVTIDKTVAVYSVITMFLMVCIGYAARKLKFIDDTFSARLSDLVICIAQPFMIVSSVLNISYSPENLKTGFLFCALGFVIHTVVALLSHLFTRPYRNPDERCITEFSILFTNCGFIGFPVLSALFGNIGVFWGAFYLIAFTIVQWTYGMFLLSRVRPQIKINLKKIFLNYGTTPCILGILLFLSRIPVPAPVMNAMDYMGSLCTPLSMLIIGGIIATIPPKKLLTNLKIFYFCFIKLIVIPVIVVLLCLLCRLEADVVFFAAVVSSLSTAANTAMFAEKYELVPEYAAQTVGMSTLLSAVTIPGIIFLTDFLIRCLG